MIGDFKEIDKKCYLIINNEGTLMKLPKLKWYHKIYLHVLYFFKGKIHIDDIKCLVKRDKKNG